MQLQSEHRIALLREIDAEQQKFTINKKEDKSFPYFRIYKELTILAYFSSLKDASQALGYVAVPSNYETITENKKGQRAWALN